MHGRSTALKYAALSRREVESDTLALFSAIDSPLTDDQVKAAYQNHINASLLRLHRFAGAAQIEKRTEDVWVQDSRGELYLDCTGGFGVFSLGHRHPEVIAAVTAQLQSQPLSSRSMLSEPLARLSKVLALLNPSSGLSHSFLCNSGTEAIEGALKLAVASTGRCDIVAMDGAFHGKTIAAVSLCGRLRYRDALGKFSLPCHHIRMGDHEALEARVSRATAAVIVEPVQGEGGIRPAPAGWLQTLREVCDRNGGGTHF